MGEINTGKLRSHFFFFLLKKRERVVAVVVVVVAMALVARMMMTMVSLSRSFSHSLTDPLLKIRISRRGWMDSRYFGVPDEAPMASFYSSPRVTRLIILVLREPK